MRGYIDENDKKNEIRLLILHPSYRGKVIAVVEGGTDVRLYRSLIEHERIEFQTIDGKRNLLSAMKDLVVEFPKRIFAICDADYDHLNSKNLDANDYSVYMTDVHDTEIMLLDSPSFDGFLLEYSSLTNLREIRESLLDKIFSCAYIVGVLRWINEKDDLKIIFKGLNYSCFMTIDGLSISIDIGKLVSELVRRSPNLSESITVEYLENRIDDLKKISACKMQVCCGHDVTKILSLVYRQRWISIDLNMDQRKVESALRIGYQKAYFSRTNLCDSICIALAGAGISLDMTGIR